MADKEVVIKISEDTYDGIIAAGNTPLDFDESLLGSLLSSVCNGILLQEGHGDLIDKNELKVGPIFNEDDERVGYMYVTEDELNQANVIVPGNKSKYNTVV